MRVCACLGLQRKEPFANALSSACQVQVAPHKFQCQLPLVTDSVTLFPPLRLPTAVHFCVSREQTSPKFPPRRSSYHDSSTLGMTLGTSAFFDLQASRRRRRVPLWSPLAHRWHKLAQPAASVFAQCCVVERKQRAADRPAMGMLEQ